MALPHPGCSGGFQEVSVSCCCCCCVCLQSRLWPCLQTDHLCCHVFVTKMCDCHVHEGGIAESIAPCICLPLAGADPSESLWHQVPNITGWWPWLGD